MENLNYRPKILEEVFQSGLSGIYQVLFEEMRVIRELYEEKYKKSLDQQKKIFEDKKVLQDKINETKLQSYQRCYIH
jgi:hypothetical protein